MALIFITSAMPCCAASQKAYWDIKQKFMDTILFYKIGKVRSFGLCGCRFKHAAVSACMCSQPVYVTPETEFDTCSFTSYTRTMPRLGLTCSAGR